MIGQWFIFEETNNLGEIVENYYPSRLLGFITTNNTQEAVSGNSMLSKSNSMGHYSAEFHCGYSAW
jgi:hypothetical protein